MRRIAPIALGGLAALAACPASKTVDCGGWVCREGNVCAEAPTYCAPPSAVEACLGQGLADLQACTLGGSAGGDPAVCRGGACFSCAAAPDTEGCRYPGWTPMTSGVTSDLTSVFAVARGDVYAGGAAGLIHYDGTTWSSVSNANVGMVVTIAGSGPHDVYVANSSEHVFHYDGTSWTDVTASPQAYSVDQLWVPAPGTLILVGLDGAWRLRDGAWTQLFAQPLERVTGAAPGDLLALQTTATSTIKHYDGASWTDQAQLEPGAPATLTWISAASSSVAYAVGKPPNAMAIMPVVLRGTGTWTSEAVPIDAVALTSVWGADADHAFAVGVNDTIIVRDANGWSPMCAAADRTVSLAAVHGSAVDDAFAVGTKGTILHYTGITAPITGTCR